MDLFSITCTTCKSRLKVREQAAVGQILACPKCGGMVMIRPPDGWAPGSPPGPRAPEPPPGITAVVVMHKSDDTASDANFDAIDDILADAPPKSRTTNVTVAPDAPGLARPRFAGAPPQIKPDSPATAVAEASAATKQKSAPTVDEVPDEAIPQFKPSRPWKHWLLLAASVVTGVGMALFVVVASIKFLAGEGRQTAEVVTPKQAPSVQPALASPGQTLPDQPASTSTNVAAPSDAKGLPAKAQAPSEVVAPPAETVPVTATPARPPTPQSPFDDILVPEKDPLAPPEAPAGETPAPPTDPILPAEAPAKPVLPRPEPREVDVAARLNDPLASLETDGTPLADFLQIMSDLSTIPITLEPDALPLAQASTTTPVVVKLANTTIGDALKAGLARLRLEYVPAERGLLVRLSEPAELAVQAYPIKDLTAGDDAAAADLAEMIQALVDPPSWKLGEAGGSVEVAADSLKIKQRRANHAQIFLLCEKLRTARKLPYASRFPATLFQLNSRTQQAAPKLKTPVSLNFQQPTPIVRILPRLEEIAGVRILVDWQDIASAGWNQAGEATLSVESGSFALALTKLLEPMDLAWRVVDGQTIQIVTPATLAVRNELEFYKVDDLLKDDPAAEGLVSRIRSELGEGIFLEQGGASEIRFDALGQCLIASLSQPKQHDLEALLIALRATAR